MGEMEEERLWLRSNAFYAEQNITLRLSAKVGGIDRAAKTLTVGDETLSYDHLVLTTGSTPAACPPPSAAISRASTPCGPWPMSTRCAPNSPRAAVW